MRTILILVLFLGAILCSSCQQESISVPIFPLSDGESTATTISVTGIPIEESSAALETDQNIEEYVVYNALLRRKYVGDEIDQLLIIDHTQVNEEALLEKDLVNFQKNAPLEKDLIDNFIMRNQESYPLKPALDFGVKYQLLTQGEVDELRLQDEASGWKLFYEQYPNTHGFVYLSRVGFNADFSEALVYISAYHYKQPIYGGYYLMTKQDGNWELLNSYEWQS